MIPCISVDNMRKSDAYTIEHFVPSLELMRRAAWGVFQAVSWTSPVAIVVGSGNNGGDGFALSCILNDHHISCTVFTVSDKRSADSAYYEAQAKNMDIPVIPFFGGCLNDFPIVVDCLLGTGFQGIVRGLYRTAIEEINQSGSYVVSVDINSGMNGDSGDAELAVYSDLTVTIGFVKQGMVQQSAGNYMKRLVCADIGIVLAGTEAQISGNHEIAGPGVYSCPPWLDMEPIPVR